MAATTWISTALNRIGNWNPQLARELQGRLKPRGIILVSGISFLCQFSLLMTFWANLPMAENQAYSLTVDGQWQGTDWPSWWGDIFQALNLIWPIALVLIGVYMLISDLAAEESRGTLNFLRLTPQSSQKILVGKLLGVPSLLYLGMLLALPLGIFGGYFWGAIPDSLRPDPHFCLSVLSVLICYCLALLLPLLGLTQAWLGCFLVSIVVVPIFLSWNEFLMGLALNPRNSAVLLTQSFFQNWRWFQIPVGINLEVTVGFFLVSAAIPTWWIWKAANRRFRNPTAAIINKGQSYLMVLTLQIWVMGFIKPNSFSIDIRYGLTGNWLTFYLFVVLPGCCLILLAALSPSHQALQDWARFYHKTHDKTRRNPRGFWNSVLVQDLLWNDKSPPLLAIALNLGIIAVCWIPWFVLSALSTPGVTAVTSGPILKLILGLCLTLGFLLIAAVVAQFLLFIKARKPSAWAAGSVILMIAVPPGILGLTSLQDPGLWLFDRIPDYRGF
ncbi:MAG: hypothetical protein HC825_01870 [Oscillatoriales cyanobacterium RM1_1_9]|nr:hypothetical protein [Oscillatoriales cyanobacterium RM1_1_9]